MLDKATIARYQRGGDIYEQLKAQYGDAGAAIVALAAQTGKRYNVTDALTRVKYGERLDENTLAIFLSQLATDPLAAPLDALDSAVDKVFDSRGFKTVLVVGAVVIVALLAIK